uniref:uncharacterized protein n=1 Tax=Pristiophorus japonicus TaxID=55135 RepID=UPI00398ECA22
MSWTPAEVTKVLPKEMKKRWNQLAEDYSAMVTTPRSGGQCKKKWQDLGQRKVAHSKRERTRTGGGLAILHPLTPLEDWVAALMGPAWRKATTTAQAGPTLEGEELEANPDEAEADTEDDSDADKPEEENIFQSHFLDQEHGGGGEREGQGDVMDEALTVVHTLEEVQVPPIEVPAPFLSGTSVGTFHGFSQSYAGDSSGDAVRQTQGPTVRACGSQWDAARHTQDEEGKESSTALS